MSVLLPKANIYFPRTILQMFKNNPTDVSCGCCLLDRVDTMEHTFPLHLSVTQ